MLRVLVVDDEVPLLQLMKRYLDRIGYDAEICSDSQVALDLLVSDPYHFHLVVADLSMPQLSGRDLVARMEDVNPEIGVLVCSGEPFDCRSIRRRNHNRIKFLQKPFTPKMLADAVGELLPLATTSDTRPR